MQRSLCILFAVALLFINFNHGLNAHQVNPTKEYPSEGTEKSFTHIGQAGQNSSYLLSSNMSVLSGENLSFVDTNIVVAGNLSLKIYGSLSLINSTITALKGGGYEDYRLCIYGNGTISSYDEISIIGSEIKMNLSLNTNYTHMRIVNSTIESAGEGTWVSYSFRNSVVDMWNSSLSGFHNFVSGYRKFVAFSSGSGYPVARNGFVKMNLDSTSSAPISGMTVSLRYSGNNPGRSDFIIINVTGAETHPVKIYPESTGSLNITEYENITYSFQNNISVSRILKNLSRMVFYNYSYGTGSNLTIWNLSIGFYTTNQFAIFGNSSYDYMLRNTTMYAAHVRLEFTGNNSMCNFGKRGHIMVLENGSTVFLETVREESDTYPFYVSAHSHLYLYGEVIINPETHGKTVFGLNYEILHAGNSSETFEFPHPLTLKPYRAILLSTSVTGGSIDYEGNYALRVLGSSMEFYMPVAREITNGTYVVENVSVEMPKMRDTLLAHRQYTDLSVLVSYSIYGISSMEKVMRADLVISGQGKILRTERTLSLNGSSVTLNFSLFPDFVLSGVYQFILNISYCAPYAVTNIIENSTLQNFSGINGTSENILFRMLSPWKAEISTPMKVSPGITGTVEFVIEMISFTGSAIYRSVMAGNNYSAVVYIPETVWLLNISLKAVNSEGSSTIISGIQVDVKALRNDMKHKVTVYEEGISAGKLWYAKYGNRTVYTRNESLSIFLDYPEETVHFGSYLFLPNVSESTVSWNASSVYVSFSKKLYTMSVKISHYSQKSEQADFILILNGYEFQSSDGTFNFSLPFGNYSISLIMVTNWGIMSRNLSVDLLSNSSMIVSFVTPALTVRSFPVYYLYLPLAFIISLALIFYFRRNHYTVCTHCGSLLRGKRY